MAGISEENQVDAAMSCAQILALRFQGLIFCLPLSSRSNIHKFKIHAGIRGGKPIVGILIRFRSIVLYLCVPFCCYFIVFWSGFVACSLIRLFLYLFYPSIVLSFYMACY